MKRAGEEFPDDSIRAGYPVTSATLLRLGRRVTRIPGSSHDVRSRHSSAILQSEFKILRKPVASAKPAIVSGVIATYDTRGKSYMTHFGLPARRHSVPFAFFLSRTAGRGVKSPRVNFQESRSLTRLKEKVKESRRKFTLHVHNPTRGNYA